MAVADSWTTERLHVEPWHGLPDPELQEFLPRLLTEAVTASLPSDWQGPFGEERLAGWVAARDAESSVFLVRANGGAAGLLITSHDRDPSVRIGYLLAESHWRQGLATELITGYLRRCEQDGDVREVLAGVAVDNGPSISALKRVGFESGGPAVGGEQMFRFTLQGDPGPTTGTDPASA